MIRIRALVLAFGALVLLASACGSTDSTVDTAQGADSASESQDEAADTTNEEPQQAEEEVAEAAPSNDVVEVVKATSVNGEEIDLIRAGEDTLLWFWAPW